VCQVSNALRVLALQRREAEHVELLENVRRMGQDTEGQNLVLKAVVLKTLVEVALAVQDRQQVPPYLARLRMRVKVLQPLQTEHIVGSVVFGD
jgi:hypothetical protein